MPLLLYFFSGLHHYECVAPLIANSLQSGRFWARSTACVGGPWQPVGVEVVLHRLHPGHPRSSWWSLPLSVHRRRGSQDLLCVYCRPFRRYARIWVRRRAWIISVSRGWLVWRRTSSLEMQWYHLMPRSIWRHHWWRALILRASSLVIAQHLTRKENRQYTADCYTWLKLSWPKTKLQNVGAGDPQSKILIDGVPVEGVEEFIYLGSNQSSDGYCRPDVLRRIGLAIQWWIQHQSSLQHCTKDW